MRRGCSMYAIRATLRSGLELYIQEGRVYPDPVSRDGTLSGWTLVSSRYDSAKDIADTWTPPDEPQWAGAVLDVVRVEAREIEVLSIDRQLFPSVCYVPIPLVGCTYIKPTPEWARGRSLIRLAGKPPVNRWEPSDNPPLLSIGAIEYRAVRAAIRLSCGSRYECKGFDVRHLGEVWVHPFPPVGADEWVLHNLVWHSQRQTEAA